jgi:glutamyl-tRNA synthetase
VIELIKPRAKKLSDIAPQMRAFLSDELVFDEAAVKKHLGDPSVLGHLEAWRAVLATLEPFDAAALEAALRALAESLGIKPGVLIHATRVAVTGQGNSPGLFEVLELVGRERVIARIRGLQDQPALRPPRT